ncbi:MAG: YqhA family protein [Planctomycetota bacterium]
MRTRSQTQPRRVSCARQPGSVEASGLRSKRNVAFLYNLFLRIASLLASLTSIVLGAGVLAFGIYQGGMALGNSLRGKLEQGEFIEEVLKGIDLLFLGMVILILGAGLYELFIRRIDRFPDWLSVHSFDELKVLLVKASITVVTISFVGRAVTWSGEESIAYYGIGIGAIIAALTYFIQVKQSKEA